MAMQGSTIYGNIAALVVVQVDTSSPYGSDPGHPGFGTVAAVIRDGAGLFPQAASRRAAASAVETSSSAQSGAGETITSPPPRQPIAPATVATGNRRYFFYGPELHLLAESELTTSPSPTILTEYIWFDDQPVAQSDTTETTSWTFTDHLGTPTLQTSAAQGVLWRAEYEPYGVVYSLRSTDQHQPLRLPGQEAEQLSAGANGMTSRSYNINRWYQPSVGRYTQFEPLRLLDINEYLYASDSPLSVTDPRGLAPSNVDEAPPGSKPCSSLGPPDPARDCCSQQAIDRAFRNVLGRRALYCGNKDKPPLQLGGTKKGGALPYPWYIPQGDTCVDKCICVHENFHIYQADSGRLKSLSHNAAECEAYTKHLGCLLKYSPGGIPLIYGAP